MDAGASALQYIGVASVQLQNVCSQGVWNEGM